MKKYDPVFLCFIDAEQAFDFVIHCKFSKLLNKGANIFCKSSFQFCPTGVCSPLEIDHMVVWVQPCWQTLTINCYFWLGSMLDVSLQIIILKFIMPMTWCLWSPLWMTCLASVVFCTLLSVFTFL